MRYLADKPYCNALAGVEIVFLPTLSRCNCNPPQTWHSTDCNAKWLKDLAATTRLLVTDLPRLSARIGLLYRV